MAASAGRGGGEEMERDGSCERKKIFYLCDEAHWTSLKIKRTEMGISPDAGYAM